MKRWVIVVSTVFILGGAALGVLKSQGQSTATEGPAKTAEGASQEPASSQKPSPESDKKKILPTVATEAAKSMAMSKTMELTGSVAATRIARMASPGEGPVRDCTVREGDLVKHGQRLLNIGRDTAARALLAAAQAGLKEQEQDLRRVEQLVQSGAIPGAQLDTARSKFESARAQVAKARESAEDFSLTAPWDGIVTKVLVRDGDYVAPRTVLVEIFDPNSLVIRFAVPEAQATEVRENMALTAQLDAYPGRNFEGKIKRVYPELDARMRTRTVEAVLGEPVDLIPGMFARINVLLQSVPEATTVSSESVIVTPKGDRIAFVVQDGKAVRRKIETGIEEGGRIQIVKGIQPGEQVIAAGNEKLKDGAEVQVRQGAGQ